MKQQERALPEWALRMIREYEKEASCRKRRLAGVRAEA